MQLKPVEDNSNENVTADGQKSSPQASPAASPFVSNNEYFNPEQEFDVTAGDMFGNPVPSETQMSGQNPRIYEPNTVVDPFDDGSINGLRDEDNHIRKLSKKEFIESPRNRKDRDRILISGFFVIAAAIFDIVRTDFWLSTFKKQIDMVNNLAEQLGVSGEYTIDTEAIMRTQIILSVILIALGLGILILKSRACAITGLAITLINCIATMVQNHQFRFYYTIIAFVFATIATINLARAWKEYEENGDWKREWKKNW